MAERGIFIDHSTLHRWVIRLVPLLDKAFRRHKRAVGCRWRMFQVTKLTGHFLPAVPITHRCQVFEPCAAINPHIDLSLSALRHPVSGEKPYHSGRMNTEQSGGIRTCFLARCDEQDNLFLLLWR